jgi:hypothetical protein
MELEGQKFIRTGRSMSSKDFLASINMNMSSRMTQVFTLGDKPLPSDEKISQANRLPRFVKFSDFKILTY